MMYPHERSLVKNMESKPFALVGVNSDDDAAALKPVLVKEQITWRSFFDGKSAKISNAWGVQGWPTLFLIDHKGIVRKVYPGVPDSAELDREIEALVKEANG